MKIFVIRLLCILIFMNNVVDCVQIHQYEDNDFAEFEDFDDDTGSHKGKTNQHYIKTHPSQSDIKFNDEQDDSSEDMPEEELKMQKPPPNYDDEDEAMVEEEDESDEFSHLADEDEFIGFSSDKASSGKTFRNGEPKITIAKVPLHLRSNWDSFYLEMLMLTGLAVYFLNFMLGKGKNQKIALAWYNSHKNLLENNFALVGDDGKNEIETPGLRKESENVYVLWCSGRTLMEGMLVEIRLLKRQDIIAVISQMMRPSSDQLIIHVKLDEMDPYVFAIATKKSASKIMKDMTDIGTYCPEKRAGEKFGLSSQYVVYSELTELTMTFTRDPKIVAVMNKYPGMLEYLHFSDQYSGPKQQEEPSTTNPPEVKKTLIFGFNFEGKGNAASESFENMIPLMQLVLYLSDKASKMKLSKEMKIRADKNRTKVQEAFLKATHVARAEMAQTLREEKKRQERERIMSLDDPDRQRKWEEREQKKQMKKRTPKMKTLKIKPM